MPSRVRALSFCSPSRGSLMSSTATCRPAGPRQRLAAVPSRPDQLELGPLADRALDALAEERVIVGDDDADPSPRHVDIIAQGPVAAA